MGGTSLGGSQATVIVYADPACPWAHLAIHRFHAERRRLGLSGVVHLDIRPFPLEVVNGTPTSREVLDAEIPVVRALDPDAGWQTWAGDESEFPDTMLPAMEAVEAAKLQGIEAAEALDFGLRHAFFAESRSISRSDEIAAVARRTAGVDEGRLLADLMEGTSRADLDTHIEHISTSEVVGSPHFFLPDGTSALNPGIEKEWVRDGGVGHPVVKSHDGSAYEELLLAAAG